MNLDISKLIEAGEDIVNDEQIGFAAEITIPVQDFEYDKIKYQLQLVLTSENIINRNISTKKA